jgi:hypothetical protein
LACPFERKRRLAAAFHTGILNWFAEKKLLKKKPHKSISEGTEGGIKMESSTQIKEVYDNEW